MWIAFSFFFCGVNTFQFTSLQTGHILYIKRDHYDNDGVWVWVCFHFSVSSSSPLASDSPFTFLGGSVSARSEVQWAPLTIIMELGNHNHAAATLVTFCLLFSFTFSHASSFYPVSCFCFFSLPSCGIRHFFWWGFLEFFFQFLILG